MSDRKFRPHSKDQRILEVLTQNARITNRDLARELEIPEHVAADRLRMLQSSGILGATVLVDYQSFGYHPFLNLQLTVEPGRFDDAVAYLTDIESISTLYGWGRFAHAQFGVHVVATSLEQAQRVLVDKIGRCPGLSKCVVHVMLGATSYNPPIVNRDLPAGPEFAIRPHGNVDELDVSIIQCLRNEGRKPYLTIAQELGVVEGTVRRRIVRLVQDGVVRFAPVFSRPGRMPVPLPCVLWIDVDPEQLEATSEILRGVPYLAGVQRMFGPRGNLVTSVSMDEQQLEQCLSELTSVVPGLRNILAEPVKQVFKFSDTWRDLSAVLPLPIDIWSPEGGDEVGVVS